MPAAPLPEDETERLRALRHTGLLESGADPLLDAIVARAAALFEVPIAMISLLDDTRMTFKAGTGLGVPHMRRDLAFCGYAILGSETLVVMDARRDARFADSPLVVGAPGIRFYAGIPIRVAGHNLGALCVLDTVVRDAVSPEQAGGLRAMAADVSRQFARSAVVGEG